jgi:CubicO group peptidase (beta-lactamase class C family)
LAACALLLLAVLLWGLLRERAAPAGVLIAGGDGGGLPRATPEEEGFDPAGLAQVLAQVQTLQVQGLLVLHHGHLVLEHYAAGLQANTLVDGGAMSEALVSLVAGVAVHERGMQLPAGAFAAAALVPAITAASERPYPDYLARSIWLPLNAAPAQLRAEQDSGAAGCCLAARASDWLRVAALLMEGGRFEGTQIVAPEWVMRMTSAQADEPGRGYGIWLAPAARGAEPFAAPGVLFLRGPGRTRLWLVPTLDLAVLLVDVAQGASRDATQQPTPFDETRVPNAVTRALRALQPTTRKGLGALVPGH